jgi:hypothetical protein
MACPHCRQPDAFSLLSGTQAPPNDSGGEFTFLGAQRATPAFKRGAPVRRRRAVPGSTTCTHERHGCLDEALLGPGKIPAQPVEAQGHVDEDES